MLPSMFKCRSMISIKLHCNFIKITLCDGCSPVNLLYILRTPFPKNTSGGLLLNKEKFSMGVILTNMRFLLYPQMEE